MNFVSSYRCSIFCHFHPASESLKITAAAINMAQDFIDKPNRYSCRLSLQYANGYRRGGCSVVDAQFFENLL